MGMRSRAWVGLYLVAAGCSTAANTGDVPVDTGAIDLGAVVMDAGMDAGVDTGAPDRTGIDRPADRGVDVTGIDRVVDTGPDRAGSCPSVCTRSEECDVCGTPGDPGGYCCIAGLCLYMSASCDAGMSTSRSEVLDWEFDDRPTNPDSNPAWGDVTWPDIGFDAGDASAPGPMDAGMDAGAGMDGDGG